MPDKITKYTFKPGLPHEFEILNITNDFNNQNQKALTTPHRTEFYHIIWFMGEDSTHMIDFKTIDVKKNTLLFLNKEIIHQYQGANLNAKDILFTDDFFCMSEPDTKFLRSSSLFNNSSYFAKIQLDKTNSSVFENIMAVMTLECNTPKDPLQGNILKNLLHNFLLNAERNYNQENLLTTQFDANLDLVFHFKELLNANFRSQKKVILYAKQLNVTTKRLNSATNKTLGINPKQMIDNRVMLEAKRLLAYTTESVKEIGFQLGFDESTNFIKFFRKQINLTPIEFRQKAA